LAPTIEPQTEPEPKGTAAAKGTIESDYIPLDPDEEPDDGMGPETPNVLDIDEGAGYEDDELPIGDRMTRLRLEQKRREMQQAIDEYSDDSQSDDEWERSRLHNARQTVPEALFHKKDDDELTEIPPVPRPEDIMGKVYRNLQSLKLQRQEMSERLLRLQNERELLGSRTSEIQIALDRTSQEFERISAEGGGSRESII
jgi:vacuolar-type H+-ATPase subunit I/STV1